MQCSIKWVIKGMLSLLCRANVPLKIVRKKGTSHFGMCVVLISSLPLAPSLLSIPGLVSSYVALDDDGLLSEELEVPPAEEASDVPLDGDGSPGLGAAPLLLQQLIQELLEEHLPKTKKIHEYPDRIQVNSLMFSDTSEHLGESQLVVSLLCIQHVQQSHRLLSV